MVRQAHHERNQTLTVRPEPVEGLNQSFLNDPRNSLVPFMVRQARHERNKSLTVRSELV